MPAIKESELKLLRPYLVGEKPGLRVGEDRDDGGEYEWDMYCPLHEDRKRSAQLNVTQGVWFCHAGCGGGSVKDLIEQKEHWVEPSAPYANGGARRNGRDEDKPAVEISEDKVQGWASALLANEMALEELIIMRGIHSNTIKKFGIGWDKSLSAYTFPVRDDQGELRNVRWYQTRPKKGRRKIWGVEGANEPRLYPVEVLTDNPNSIIICEGELDALITMQYGFPAVTRTAAARVWRAEWNKKFEGKTVYLCHDCDETGMDANRKVGRALLKVAKDIKVIRLPYPIVEKHGKDLTDFWMERDGDTAAFQRLLDEAQPFAGDEAEEPERLDPSDASVLDALDSRRVGKPLRLTVTIKGKREPGYTVPRKVRFRCTRDAGAKCNFCPLFSSGDDEKLIAGSDPLVLELMDSTKNQVQKAVREHADIPQCTKLSIDVTEHQAVEVLFARPSVDHINGNTGDQDAYKNLKLTSVGRHDTMPNNTVSVVGALHPDPRKQLNEFLAWDVTRMASSLDRFQIDNDAIKLMERFRPRPGQPPLKKLREIADELSHHVTFIYGRPQMHAAMDLVFHSVLGFNFAGKRVSRGWLDLLVIGDTRTGKSEAATRLSKFYRAGEIISCEAASFAGIIGGLQQYGASKEWAITWGAVPINDRRLVVLDEASGLEPEEIAAMSSVRSSGIAELAKIRQERTYARTRLIWLANPRNAKMSDYTYGVQAIKPLVGNPEDIARFDLAMSVHPGDVKPEEINKPRAEGRQRYTAEACSTLLRWAWSRTAEQVVWTRSAERMVFSSANDMGRRYVEDPPLIQAANVREKIARFAVAIAARLFSADETGEKIVVKREHVQAAVSFIDSVYDMEGFGYAERSREIINDRKYAQKRKKEIRRYLSDKPGLAKFLRSAGKFRRQDLEEIMNIDREFANGIITTLWEARMVRKVKGDVWVEPTLHDLLREVR